MTMTSIVLEDEFNLQTLCTGTTRTVLVLNTNGPPGNWIDNSFLWNGEKEADVPWSSVVVVYLTEKTTRNMINTAMSRLTGNTTYIPYIAVFVYPSGAKEYADTCAKYWSQL